jgi:hypothetical protein
MTAFAEPIKMSHPAVPAEERRRHDQDLKAKGAPVEVMLRCRLTVRSFEWLTPRAGERQIDKTHFNARSTDATTSCLDLSRS